MAQRERAGAGADGSVIAALSVSGPIDRLGRRPGPRFAPGLVRGPTAPPLDAGAPALSARQRRFTTAKQSRNLARITVPAMDVVLVRWPEENFHLGELRGAGTPRLLLVGPEAAPPDSTDPLEDWIRLPAEDRDVRARVATLEARASNGQAVARDRRGRPAPLPGPLGLAVAGRARARRARWSSGSARSSAVS